MNSLNDVESVAEAAKQWGISSSAINKKCLKGGTKLVWKKSGNVNLVTRASMDEEYGTILGRILNGKHHDPEYGILCLIERAEITVELLKAAGVKSELIVALKNKK